MEQRLHVAPWALPPNANNDVIRLGCEKLGYHWKVIPRNVLGCWNLGYCGMGCPVNAKQSMLVTTIPATLDKGGELLYLARANRLLLDGDKVTGLECLGMDERLSLIHILDDCSVAPRYRQQLVDELQPILGSRQRAEDLADEFGW